MTIYTLIVLSLVFVYTTLIGAFIIGWIRTPEFKLNKNQYYTPSFISVVIAFRNEETNLQSLLQSIKLQDYPSLCYEIIFVNDHSEDDGAEIIKNYIAEFTNLTLMHLPEGSYGKKNAVQLGFKQAKGEIIVTTDADCTLPPKWLSVYNEFYLAQQKPDMIIGLVDLKAKQVLQKIFRLEFLSLIASSAGACSLNHPIFNNGANLAIKAERIKENIDLKNNLVSGDDVFLLHYFKKNRYDIKLLKSKNHVVNSIAPKRIGDFFSQRIRWASKASDYDDLDTLFISWIVFLTNIGLLSSVIAFTLSQTFYFLAILWGLKLMVDFTMFFSQKSFFELKLTELLLVPIIELIYPLYIVVSAISSKIKPFQWKGRKH